MMACCLAGAKPLFEPMLEFHLTEHLITIPGEILIKIYTFSFRKMHLKMSSGKCRPICLGLNVLQDIILIVHSEMTKRYRENLTTEGL